MYYRRYEDVGYVYRLGRLHAALANSKMQGCVCFCGGELKVNKDSLREKQRLFTWHGNAPAEGEPRALLVRLPYVVLREAE
jgi:hypothetical protein